MPTLDLQSAQEVLAKRHEAKRQSFIQMRNLVTEPGWKALEAYLSDRIDGYTDDLLKAKEIGDVRAVQARILELRELLKLKQEVLDLR